MRFVVVLNSSNLDTFQKALQFANYAYTQGDEVRVFLWETRDQLTEVPRENLVDWEQGDAQPAGPIVASVLRPVRTSAQLEHTGAAGMSEFYTLVKTADQVVTF